MSRAAAIEHLREAIAGVAARERPAARLSLIPALDAALGGGLSGDGLHEIVAAAPGDAAAAFGFALALGAGFLAAAGPAAGALLIVDDFGAREAGAPYGPGLAAFGLAMERLVFVRAADERALLWAMEEALKSGAPAFVLGEIGALRRYGLSASRRLLLAARAGSAPALLVASGGLTQGLSTAADSRFEIAAAPSARRASAGDRLPLPGPPAFALRLAKARLRPGATAPPAALDEASVTRVEWDSVRGSFREPTIPFPLVRAPVERPGARAAAR